MEIGIWGFICWALFFVVNILHAIIGSGQVSISMSLCTSGVFVSILSGFHQNGAWILPLYRRGRNIGLKADAAPTASALPGCCKLLSL